MLCSFFTQIDENWFFFHLEFIINKAAVNIFVHLIVQNILSIVCFYSTLQSNSYTNRKKWLDPMLSLFNFLKVYQMVFQNENMLGEAVSSFPDHPDLK